MRRLVLFTAMALLSASAANAQQLLADANKDGRVTQAEYQDSRRTFLMRADKNKDGKISADEWAKGAERVRSEVRENGVDGWQVVGKAGTFAMLDTNKDGFVTPTEIDAGAAARFTKLDPNHDGVVTRAEARQIEKAATK